METKICKKCGKELPVDKFYIHRKGTRIGGMTYAILYLEVL